MAEIRCPTPRTCSFCGAAEHETTWLVVGPAGANICHECVRHCVEIIDSKVAEDAACQGQHDVALPPSGEA